MFFDLKNVQLTPELKDKVLTYGSDVVNKIRVGRHPDNTVRVVLDFEDVSKYSVFTLYGPFRLVIDAERAVARTVATPTVVRRVSTGMRRWPTPRRPSAAARAATPIAPARRLRRRSATGAVMVIPSAAPPSAVPSPVDPKRTSPADFRSPGNSV